MKKYVAILLCVLMVSSLVACGGNEETGANDMVTAYKDKANELIESGDIDTAIEALEEGVEQTGSDELQQMLDELKETSDAEDDVSSTESGSDDAGSTSSQDNLTDETVNEQTFNIEDYVGWWKEYNDYTSGGMRLNIYDDGEYVWFVLSYSRENDYQIADTSIMLLKEKLNKNIIESAFSDSFGNYGYVSIELTPNQVICKISNVKEPYYGANWGIFEGEYILPYYEMQH